MQHLQGIESNVQMVKIIFLYILSKSTTAFRIYLVRTHTHTHVLKVTACTCVCMSTSISAPTLSTRVSFDVCCVLQVFSAFSIPLPKLPLPLPQLALVVCVRKYAHKY